MIRGMIQIALLRTKSSEGKEGDGLIRNLEEFQTETWSTTVIKI